MKSANDISPHPDCTTTCSVDIVDVQPSATGDSIDITQTMTEANLYTCTIAGLSGTMTNNGVNTQTTMTTAQSAASYDSTPATWDALVWANFPMDITQNVVINSSYLDADLCTASDTYSFQPPCEFEINSHTMTADIVEGAAWGDHKLTFTDKLDAYVGPYCPDMSASRVLTRGG